MQSVTGTERRLMPGSSWCLNVVGACHPMREAEAPWLSPCTDKEGPRLRNSLEGLEAKPGC